MFYFIEFICAVLFIAGILLFGVFALSKVVAVLLAVCVTVAFLRMEAAKGLFFVGAGFAVCALVVASLSRAFF